MSWTKLSDDFTDDCWSLSDAAYRLHSDGLVWSNRKLLDLFIPKEDVPRFAKRPEAVTELLDHGFWKDVGSKYLIRHHAQYQRTREAVIKQQDTNRENGGKGGRSKGQGREQVGDVTNRETQSLTDSLTDPLTQSLTQPVPQGFQAPPETESVISPANSRVETQSLSEPLTEPLTERDRTGIYEEVPSNSSETTYPTDPKAVEWRKRIDAKNISSIDQLMKAANVPRDEAAKMWAAAFPESRAA